MVRVNKNREKIKAKENGNQGGCRLKREILLTHQVLPACD